VDLTGKVAIVTGASRVACAARATDEAPLSTPGTIDATVERITHAGGTAIPVATNLARDDEVRAMVDRTVDAYGGVDILVNNAAITFPGDLQMELKRFDLVFNIDLRAPLLAMQAALPSMRARGGGRIVNVSSAAALNYIPELMAYGMAKIALEHLTVSAAAQLRGDGIAVNTFRIDLPVASEGFIANFPELDHSDWEPTDVAAEGILWMIGQPSSYTGNNVGMARLRAEEGIMGSGTERPRMGSTAMLTENPMRLP
jgi:NAD(P)-dependent dehydrogenase (short-subunit alcohol dehydrogenase family)